MTRKQLRDITRGDVVQDRYGVTREVIAVWESRIINDVLYVQALVRFGEVGEALVIVSERDTLLPSEIE